MKAERRNNSRRSLKIGEHLIFDRLRDWFDICQRAVAEMIVPIRRAEPKLNSSSELATKWFTIAFAVLPYRVRLQECSRRYP
jgi:hypothetical protein